MTTEPVLEVLDWNPDTIVTLTPQSFCAKSIWWPEAIGPIEKDEPGASGPSEGKHRTLWCGRSPTQAVRNSRRRAYCGVDEALTAAANALEVRRRNICAQCASKAL